MNDHQQEPIEEFETVEEAKLAAERYAEKARRAGWKTRIEVRQ